MTVVGTDSCEIEPVEVDSVFLAIGERVNVLVNASQTPGELTLSIYYLMKLNRQGMKAFWFKLMLRGSVSFAAWIWRPWLESLVLIQIIGSFEIQVSLRLLL